MSDITEPDESARACESELSDRDRGKYRVLSEIARGGMGVVLRAHDKELGRDVAIKVLDPALADREEVKQRFVEEAQIGGQLQHPGIVPVYELGLMADARPWFAMKLVKGRTLAELLTERKTAEEGPGKLLGVFEAICQTVAYAHSKDVIHRDLKPANVMVGAFGEVQVVDWGLAKVLSGEAPGNQSALSRESLMTVIETVRSKEGSSNSSASIVGSVLGTPAYMPPEQAQGNIERLDARADVFSLGAILCEILTGAPVYVAEEGGPAVLELAADAALEPAMARLERASVDDELKQICLRCLAPARGSRPKDAAFVAEAIHDHIARTEERAHHAELAAAEQKLSAERATRRVQVTLLLAGLVLLAVAGGGGGAWWMNEQRAVRAAVLSRAFGAIQPDILQAYRNGDHERALELATDAKRLVDAGEPNEELRQRANEAVLQAEERLAAEREIEAELLRLAEFEAFLEASDTGGLADNDDAETLAAYEAGFAEAGIVLDGSELAKVLELHRYTELGTRIARGLDEWARVLRRQPDADPFRVNLLAGLGLDLDPDPVRADVRLCLVARDVTTLLDLCESVDLNALPSETVHAIGRALGELGRSEESCHVLSRGAELHPSDFLLNHGAGIANHDEGNGVRALGFLRVAISMRPDNADLHAKLSDVYRQLGDYLGAWEQDMALLRIAPDGDWTMRLVADDGWWLGRWQEAAGFFQQAIEDQPQRTDHVFWKLNAECYAGLRPREEILAEIAEHMDHAGGFYPAQGATAYASLLVVVPEGDAPDPERALAYMGDVDGGVMYDFWLVRAAAFARLGRGQDVLRMTDRAVTSTMRDEVNWYEQALLELMTALGHSLIGEAEHAAYHLRMAQSARATLFGGREEQWSESWLQMFFDQFEPMIDRR